MDRAIGVKLHFAYYRFIFNVFVNIITIFQDIMSASKLARNFGRSDFYRDVKKLISGRRSYETIPSLTKDRYPHVKRGNFNRVTEKDIDFFKSVLGSRVLTEESDVNGFNVDWLKMVRGKRYYMKLFMD